MALALDLYKSVALVMDIHCAWSSFLQNWDRSIINKIYYYKSVALAMDIRKSGFSCTENRSYVKVDADVLGSPSLTVRTISVELSNIERRTTLCYLC